MKKISIFIMALVALNFVSCKEDAAAKVKEANLKSAQAKNAGNNEDAPVITFEKTEHDWGEINEGDNVKTTFKFKNTGKSELIITDIKGSCGCTVPKNWNREPIMPGGEGEFSVEFNSKGKPNNQQKTVTVTCNTAQGKETVRVKAFVKPDPEQEKIREERRKQNAERAAKAKAEREAAAANK